MSARAAWSAERDYILNIQQNIQTSKMTLMLNPSVVEGEEGDGGAVFLQDNRDERQKIAGQFLTPLFVILFLRVGK